MDSNFKEERANLPKRPNDSPQQNRYIPPDAPRCPRCSAQMEERGVREDELTTRLVPLNPQNRLFGCPSCGYPVPRDFHAPPANTQG